MSGLLEAFRPRHGGTADLSFLGEQPLMHPTASQLYLVEVFESIQGEGPDMGKPSTFIRLAGCNRRCAWCDTDKRHRYISPIRLFAEMLNDYLEAKDKEGAEEVNLVFTGGEPTLQAEALNCVLSLTRLNHGAVSVWNHLETNGTRLDSEAAKLCKFCKTVCISPKPPSAYNQPCDWAAIWEFIATDGLWTRAYVKTVIKTASDLDWLIAGAADPQRTLNTQIVIQTYVDPLGDGMADFRGYWQAFLTSERLTWMRQHNVRIMPRLQNLIWGNHQGY